jgi:hypothetical protein
MDMNMNFRLDKETFRKIKELSEGKRIMSAIIRTAILNYPSSVKPDIVKIHQREFMNIGNVPVSDSVDKKISKMSAKWKSSKTSAYNTMIKYMLDNNMIETDKLS